MKNVEVKVEGTTMTLTVDLEETFGPSASGKTIIIASSEGNQSVPDSDYADVKFGLNVYRPR